MQAVWHKAVIEGDVNEVNRLVSQGYDVDSRDRYGQTALMLSAAARAITRGDLTLTMAPSFTTVLAIYSLTRWI